MITCNIEASHGHKVFASRIDCHRPAPGPFTTECALDDLVTSPINGLYQVLLHAAVGKQSNRIVEREE